MSDDDRLRLILTAHDVGAAGHMAELARCAPEQGVQCILVAQGHAQTYFDQRGIAYVDAATWLEGPANDRSGIDLAVAQLKQLNAQAVVCGRSAPPSQGIDEIVLAAARRHGIPCLAVQDFWGDVFADAAMQPDAYLVMDALAAQITTHRTEASVCVSGSLKHARFDVIDFERLRQLGRSALGVAPESLLIGYFGQNLSALPGYSQVLTDVGRSVAQLGGAQLVYKPHPRETVSAQARTQAIFTEVGIRSVLAGALDIEMAIATVDIVISCFSTVALDAAYMMCAKNAPNVSIVCADYPQDVQAYWRPVTGLSEFPLVSEGIALSAHDQASLEAALCLGLQPSERARQARTCAAVFGRSRRPIKQVFDLINAFVRDSGALLEGQSVGAA